MISAGSFRLRKFAPSDFDQYYRLVSNEKVMEMISGKAMTPGEARIRFEKIIHNNSWHPHFGYYRIEEKRTDCFIGLAKLEIGDDHPHEAELGYMLLPEFWGRGIAGEVSAALVKYVRSSGEISRIFAIIDPANIPSRKILVKCGFVSKGRKDFDGLPGEILELILNS